MMRCEKFYLIWRDEVAKLLSENPQATSTDIAKRVAIRFGCVIPSASKVSRVMRYIDFCEQYGLDMGRISEHTIRRVLALPERYHGIIGRILTVMMEGNRKRIGKKTLDGLLSNLGIKPKEKPEPKPEPIEFKFPEPKPEPKAAVTVLVKLSSNDYVAVANAAMKMEITDSAVAYIAIKDWLERNGYL